MHTSRRTSASPIGYPSVLLAPARSCLEVTSLWKVPYASQLTEKHDEMCRVLRKMSYQLSKSLA
jgi:hypothetical protein